MVERFLGKEEVPCSSLGWGLIKKSPIENLLGFDEKERRDVIYLDLVRFCRGFFAYAGISSEGLIFDAISPILTEWYLLLAAQIIVLIASLSLFILAYNDNSTSFIKTLIGFVAGILLIKFPLIIFVMPLAEKYL